MSMPKGHKCNKPPIITPALFQKCLVLIEQGKPVSTVCEMFGFSTRTFWEFLQADQKNENLYALAKDRQIENLLEEIHLLEDKMLMAIGQCDPKIANAVATGYRTKIDNLKWIAAKLKPKKYGERLNLDADTTLRVTVTDDRGKGVMI